MNCDFEEFSIAYRLKDRQRLDVTYKKCFNKLFLYCQPITKEASEAEDIASKTMVKLWEAIKNGKAIDSHRNWAYTIARNDCLTFLNTKNRRRDLLGRRGPFKESIDPEINKITDKEFWTRILKIILTEKEYKIFSLHLEGLKNHEIAAELNIPKGTVENVKSEAKKKLKKYFSKVSFENIWNTFKKKFQKGTQI